MHDNDMSEVDELHRNDVLRYLHEHDEGDEGVPYEHLRHALVEEGGGSPSRLAWLLADLKRDGEVYQPADGCYRATSEEKPPEPHDEDFLKEGFGGERHPREQFRFNSK
jgi:hypothetical protein